MERTGIPTLTEREKETLRLLLKGHDAKSIARLLGLSVHTINERLRDARRKLDVASSREAARRLAEAEGASPQSLGDELLGVPATPPAMLPVAPASERHGAAHRLAWLSGGMLVMSLLIAAVAVLAVHQGSAAPGTPPAGQAVSADASASASQGAARLWLGLLDHGRWQESWQATATLFRSQVTAEQWTASVRSVRDPLGAVHARRFLSVTKANALPGAPAGDYEVLQFRTDFAGRGAVVETVTLARDGNAWRVIGYFVK